MSLGILHQLGACPALKNKNVALRARYSIVPVFSAGAQGRQTLLQHVSSKGKMGFPTIQPCSKLTGFSCICWIEPGNPSKAEGFLNKSVPKIARCGMKGMCYNCAWSERKPKNSLSPKQSFFSESCLLASWRQTHRSIETWSFCWGADHDAWLVRASICLWQPMFLWLLQELLRGRLSCRQISRLFWTWASFPVHPGAPRKFAPFQFPTISFLHGSRVSGILPISKLPYANYRSHFCYHCTSIFFAYPHSILYAYVLISVSV